MTILFKHTYNRQGFVIDPGKTIFDFKIDM